MTELEKEVRKFKALVKKGKNPKWIYGKVRK
jgi:hypothetical protein